MTLLGDFDHRVRQKIRSFETVDPAEVRNRRAAKEKDNKKYG